MSILVGSLTTKNKLKLPQSREVTKKNQIQKTLSNYFHTNVSKKAVLTEL
jgi:hypothetical protein